MPQGQSRDRPVLPIGAYVDLLRHVKEIQLSRKRTIDATENAEAVNQLS